MTLRLYLLAGAAVVGVGLYLWIASLTATIERQDRELATAARIAAQADIAARVAQQAAARDRLRAAEFQALTRRLIEGGTDGPLDPDIRRAFDALAGRGVRTED